MPALKSEEEAAELLDRDLTVDINRENLVPSPFEYQPKQKSVNLRISEELAECGQSLDAPPQAFRINVTSARH